MLDIPVDSNKPSKEVNPAYTRLPSNKYVKFGWISCKLDSSTRKHTVNTINKYISKSWICSVGP